MRSTWPTKEELARWPWMEETLHDGVEDNIIIIIVVVEDNLPVCYSDLQQPQQQQEQEQHQRPRQEEEEEEVLGCREMV